MFCMNKYLNNLFVQIICKINNYGTNFCKFDQQKVGIFGTYIYQLSKNLEICRTWLGGSSLKLYNN